MSDEQCLCARCADMGNTCCQRTQVFITKGDIERIAKEVGGLDFYEYIASEYRAIDYDPVWSRIFDKSGARRILRHKADTTSCIFLEKNGCRLAMDVRPLVCRLYPFDYTDGCIKGVDAHLCPPPERDNTALILGLLTMNREEAEAWRAMLYQEIRDEFPDADQRSA